MKFLWSGNLLQRYVFFAFLLMFWTKAPSCVTLLFHNNIQNFHPSSGLFKKESRASGGLWVKHWLRKDCIVVSFAWLTTKKGTCKNLWSLWRDRHFLKTIWNYHAFRKKRHFWEMMSRVCGTDLPDKDQDSLEIMVRHQRRKL